MNENPVNAEVQSFNRNSLKKVETKTATGLPTKEGEHGLDKYASSFPPTCLSPRHWDVFLSTASGQKTAAFSLFLSFVIDAQQRKGSSQTHREVSAPARLGPLL